jgi:hypothetical protein
MNESMLKFKKFIIGVIATMGIFVTVQQVYAEVDPIMQEFDDWFIERGLKPNQRYEAGKLSRRIQNVASNAVLGSDVPKKASNMDLNVYSFKKVLDELELAQQKGFGCEYVCMTSAYKTWEKLHSLEIEAYIIGAESGMNFSHFAAVYKRNGIWVIADLCYGTLRSGEETNEDRKRTIMTHHLEETPIDFMNDCRTADGRTAIIWYYFDPAAPSPRKAKNIYDLVPDVMSYLVDNNFYHLQFERFEDEYEDEYEYEDGRLMVVPINDDHYSRECNRINGFYMF